MKVTTDAREVKVGLLPESAQLLWSVAYDDDQIAGGLLDMFVLAGANRLFARLRGMMASERVDRIRILERELRIQVLRSEEELGNMMATYARNELVPEDDIPF
jgi:hypothetical protein